MSPKCLCRSHFAFTLGLKRPVWLLLILLLPVCFGSPVLAGVKNPIEAIAETADTSSPRDTLTGFMAVMKWRYEVSMGPHSLLSAYLNSGNLYPDRHDSRQAQIDLDHARMLSAKFYDVSDIPSAIVEQAAWRLTIQLIEILTRIPLPDAEDIPDAKGMDLVEYKKWTIPGTEIRIARMESGPRAGEYLFTRETLAHIPILYERIKDQPRLTETYGHMYDFVYERPSGVAFALRSIFPPRWLLALPDWMRFHIFAEPLWRWFILFIIFSIILRVTWYSYRLSHGFPNLRSTTMHAMHLITPCLILMLIPPTIFIIGEVLRVSPHIFGYMSLTLWGFFYLILTSLVWSIGNLIAEWIINMERVQVDSTDSQLIRIAARIIAGVVGLAILVEGANRIGLPSYSIFAGLGVGGLAFALAGQQTLGNLLGSLIIMFEKPFRIGHSIQTGGHSGTVEHIGFRTAVLRTRDGDVLYVPSSELLRHSIENKTLRDYWRIQRTIALALDTPFSKIEHFKVNILNVLLDHPDIVTDTARVTFIGIETQGHRILLDFVITTSLEEKQLNVTETILTRVVQIAEELGIAFAADND